MQLAPELGRLRAAILDRRYQFEDPFEASAGLLEEKREEFRISQIFVQFRRFTSTPSVPTISPAWLDTATAMVKQGSPVNSES